MVTSLLIETDELHAIVLLSRVFTVVEGGWGSSGTLYEIIGASVLAYKY